MGSLEPVYYFENIYGLKIGPSLGKVIYALKKCITGGTILVHLYYLYFETQRSCILLIIIKNKHSCKQKMST